MGNVDSSNKSNNSNRKSNTSRDSSEKKFNNQAENILSNRNKIDNTKIKLQRNKSLRDIMGNKIKRSNILKNIDSLKITQIASKITNKVLLNNLDYLPVNLFSTSLIPYSNPENLNLNMNKDIVCNLNNSFNEMIFLQDKNKEFLKKGLDKFYLNELLKNNKLCENGLEFNNIANNKDELNNCEIKKLIKEKIEKILKENDIINSNINESGINSNNKELISGLSSDISNANEYFKDNLDSVNSKNYSNNKINESKFESENNYNDNKIKKDKMKISKINLSKDNFNKTKTRTSNISSTSRSKSPQQGKFEMMKNYNKMKLTGFFVNKNNEENPNITKNQGNYLNSPATSEKKGLNTKRNLKELHLKIKINPNNRSPDKNLNNSNINFKKENINKNNESYITIETNPGNEESRNKKDKIILTERNKTKSKDEFKITSARENGPKKISDSYYDSNYHKDLSSEKNKKNITNRNFYKTNNNSKSPDKKYILTKLNKDNSYIKTEVVDYKPEKFNPELKIKLDLKDLKGGYNKNEISKKPNESIYKPNYTKDSSFQAEIDKSIRSPVNYQEYSKMNFNKNPEISVKANKITYSELMKKNYTINLNNSTINKSNLSPSSNRLNDKKNTNSYKNLTNNNINNNNQNNNSLIYDKNTDDLIVRKLEKNKLKLETERLGSSNFSNFKFEPQTTKNNSSRNSLIKKKEGINENFISNKNINNNNNSVYNDFDYNTNNTNETDRRFSKKMTTNNFDRKEIGKNLEKNHSRSSNQISNDSEPEKNTSRNSFSKNKNIHKEEINRREKYEKNKTTRNNNKHSSDNENENLTNDSEEMHEIKIKMKTESKNHKKNENQEFENIEQYNNNKYNRDNNSYDRSLETNKDKLMKLKNLKFTPKENVDNNNNNKNSILKYKEKDHPIKLNTNSFSSNSDDNIDINLIRKNTPVLGTPLKNKNTKNRLNSFGDFDHDIKNEYKDEMLNKDFDPNIKNTIDDVAGEKFSFRNNLEEQEMRYSKKIKDDNKINKRINKNNENYQENYNNEQNQNYRYNKNKISQNEEIKFIKPLIKNYEDYVNQNQSDYKEEPSTSRKNKNEKKIYNIDINNLQNENYNSRDNSEEEFSENNPIKNINIRLNKIEESAKNNKNYNTNRKNKIQEYENDNLRDEGYLKSAERSTNYSPNPNNNERGSFGKDNFKRNTNDNDYSEYNSNNKKNKNYYKN